MKKTKAVIQSKDEIWHGAFLLRVDAPEIAKLAQPGQYIMVRCGEGQEMPLRRPLSLHRIYNHREIGLLFELVGKGTAWLSQCNVGDIIDVFGPLGNGFQIYPSSKRLLLIAGGIGVAPLMALAYKAVDSGQKVKFYFGTQNQYKLFPDHLLPPGIKIAVATEDGSYGHCGMVTDLLCLPEHLTEIIEDVDQIFACGSLPMYKKMSEISHQMGNKPTQVLLETVMGCGVGACLGCSIKTKNGRKRVCKDGPVFDLKEILLDEINEPPHEEARSLT